jgi:uncharacterized membrane protein YcaP (DUF421 family)
MDLWRIAARVLFAYLMLQAMLRVAGKRTVTQASPFEFTLSLILGDMVDDMMWAEVDASVFVVAVSVLMVVHLSLQRLQTSAARWR